MSVFLGVGPFLGWFAKGSLWEHHHFLGGPNPYFKTPSGLDKNSRTNKELKSQIPSTKVVWLLTFWVPDFSHGPQTVITLHFRFPSLGNWALQGLTPPRKTKSTFLKRWFGARWPGAQAPNQWPHRLSYVGHPVPEGLGVCARAGAAPDPHRLQQRGPGGTGGGAEAVHQGQVDQGRSLQGWGVGALLG